MRRVIKRAGDMNFMVTSSLSIAKITLLTTLSLAGIKTNTDVSTMDDADAATVISNLVSPLSRKTFEGLISLQNPEMLNSDESAALKAIINEATTNLSESTKPFD
jgi:hypothetical protein